MDYKCKLWKSRLTTLDFICNLEKYNLEIRAKFSNLDYSAKVKFVSELDLNNISDSISESEIQSTLSKLGYI